MEQSSPSTTQDREQSANFPHTSIRGLSVSLHSFHCYQPFFVTLIILYPLQRRAGQRKCRVLLGLQCQVRLGRRIREGSAHACLPPSPTHHGLGGKTCDSGGGAQRGSNLIWKALLERMTIQPLSHLFTL